MSGAGIIEARPARAQDLDGARRMLAAEGWDFRRDELERVMGLGGGMGAFDQGRLVGFLTYVDLDPVRWIGNVVVDPAARGKGVGATLIDATLRAPGRVSASGLYSVEPARTLYERAGFVARGEAWALRAEEAPAREGASERVVPMQDTHLARVFRLDRARSGMDRRALLGELFAAYPDYACVVEDAAGVAGFGFAKPYEGATELGPIVADSPQVARVLLDALLEVTPTPHEVTVLADNAAAWDMLRKRGFEGRFRTIVMFQGSPPAWDVSALHAAAGLEKS